METISSKKTEAFLKIVIGVAFLVIIFLLFLLVKEYKHVRQLDYVRVRPSSLLNTLRAKGPATINNVSSIQTWMTFDYINHLFNIPPPYIQTSLSINDSRYPHLTISQYADKTNISKTSFLTKVQDVVRVYLTQK